MNHKASFYQLKDKDQKLIVAKKSRRKLSSFYQEVNNFFDSLYFLQGFNFPVNHKMMRDSYDQLKRREDLAGMNFAQDLFFKRKIYEDGASTLIGEGLI